MLKKLKESTLGKNTVWVLSAHSARLIIMGAYLIVLARALGSEAFGAFSAGLAVVLILQTFAGIGFGPLLILNVARKPEDIPEYWGNALVVLAASGGLLIVLVAMFCNKVLPALSRETLFLLALAEIFFFKIFYYSYQTFVAFERLDVGSKLFVVFSGSKLVAVVLYVSVATVISVDTWARWYLGAVAAPALVGFIWVSSNYGLPRPKMANIKRGVGEGIHFSISEFSRRTNIQADKALLSRLSTLEATGVYAVGYRIMMMAYMPLQSLFTAALARFYRAGKTGIHNSLSFVRSILPYVAGYCILVPLLLLGASPLIPWVLGPDYNEAASVARWLCLVPLLFGSYAVAAETLTGAGYIQIRSRIQFLAMALNIVLNIVLIPIYSWRGSATAILASEIFLSVALWLAVWIKAREETADRITGKAWY